MQHSERHRIFFFKSIFLFLGLGLVCSGCVMGFSNSQRHIPKEYALVYVPTASDSSVSAGNAGRVSYAVRDLLSKRTDIKLVSVHEARWALQMTILDRKQTIVAVDDCTNTGNPTVGSGAFLCTTIHPEIFNENTTLPTSFNQPSVSPSQESIALVVSVRAIDLNTGQALWAKLYHEQVPPVVFNEIGDTGDRITMTQLQNMPDLHAMRYQEVVESAVQSYAQAIASDIENLILTSFPRS